ncbi:MAG: serine/threonine protein kinase [Pseudomonadota bacterium]
MPDPTQNPEPGQVLKSDLFGEVSRLDGPDTQIRRDTAKAPWWTRPIARALARREARTLEALQGLDGVPQLLDFDGVRLTRSFLAGQPMHHARPRDPAYFREAQALLFALHARDVIHNDTAKEPNWLVLDDGRPGLIDFQLAAWRPSRSRLFRSLAREDIRHLLKHKRTYAPDALTARQRAILNTPGWTSRAWRATVKPVYLFITRRLLGWADREGAGDRGSGVR